MSASGGRPEGEPLAGLPRRCTLLKGGGPSGEPAPCGRPASGSLMLPIFRSGRTYWEIRYEWVEAITAAPRTSAAGTPLGSGPVPLEDLRTTAHNVAAADRIVQRIREWTSREEVVLHASVAGGRKTMGLFLSQAMSWFARPGDDLSHVLVPQAFENRTFFFPEPGNPDHAEVVDFALLPFVRMRGLRVLAARPRPGGADGAVRRRSGLALDPLEPVRPRVGPWVWSIAADGLLTPDHFTTGE